MELILKPTRQKGIRLRNWLTREQVKRSAGRPGPLDAEGKLVSRRRASPARSRASAQLSRTETDAWKEHSVIFVLISRTNFSRNFVRVLCATVRNFSAATMQLNPGKRSKTNKRDLGFECSVTSRDLLASLARPDKPLDNWEAAPSLSGKLLQFR